MTPFCFAGLLLAFLLLLFHFCLAPHKWPGLAGPVVTEQYDGTRPVDTVGTRHVALASSEHYCVRGEGAATA